MKPCFGYVRVSTLRQGDGASLEAQKDAITGFASQNNLTITRWFEEKETASKVGRPVFEALIKALRNGEAEGLVIHKIDRSARNFSDWARLDDVADLGVNIYFAADSLDFGTRGGRLLADIQMALAADYSRNLSQEVKKGIYGRIKHGIYPFRAPLGYLDTGGGNVKTIDPIKAPQVRQVFELYCTGDYSITGLTEEMRRRGLKGLGEKLIVRRNIESILANPFYCGKMRVCGKLYPGQHKPLVSATTMRKIAAIKQDRFQKKSTTHKLMFRGLFRCAGCNCILTGERQRAHVYYRCHTQGCNVGSIREDRLEAKLLKKFKALQIRPEDEQIISERVKSWLEDEGYEEIEKSLRLRIANTKDRQDRLTDLLVDGAIDQAAFQVRKDNLAFELQALREEMKRHTEQRTTMTDLEEQVSLATNLWELFRASPPLQKRAMIRNCLVFPMIEHAKISCNAADWLQELRAVARDPKRSPDANAFSNAAKAMADKVSLDA